MERLAAQADQRRVELGFPEWSRVKGAGLANLFTVQMDLPDRAARMWRDRIGALLDLTEKHNTGVLWRRADENRVLGSRVVRAGIDVARVRLGQYRSRNCARRSLRRRSECSDGHGADGRTIAHR